MYNYVSLKPHFRVLELLGGTGNGKTEVGTVPAEPKARKILIEGVGSTNSTLTERLMVFTTEYSDKMIVAVKHDENAFSRNLFTEIVSKAIAKVVKDLGKVVDTIVGKDEEILEEALIEQLNKRNNVKAILSLLTAEQKEALGISWICTMDTIFISIIIISIILLRMKWPRLRLRKTARSS